MTERLYSEPSPLWLKAADSLVTAFRTAINEEDIVAIEQIKLYARGAAHLSETQIEAIRRVAVDEEGQYNGEDF